MFHQHVDCPKKPPVGFEEAMAEYGFRNTNFSVFPDGHSGPVLHLTFKTGKVEIFHDAWKKATQCCRNFGISGYMEGELVFTDDPFVVPQSYKEDWNRPFVLERRCLKVEEGFRQTELHIAYREDGSHSEVWKRLSDMGMMIAVMPKTRRGENFNEIIATAQGNIAQIRPLKEKLKIGLTGIGLMHDATLKEEVIIAYELFNITTENLPPVLATIK